MIIAKTRIVAKVLGFQVFASPSVKLGTEDQIARAKTWVAGFSLINFKVADDGMSASLRDGGSELTVKIDRLQVPIV